MRADQTFDGVPKLLPLLEYDIRIPVFDEKFQRINQFYQNLASECVKYAENELTQKSASEYLASLDTKKRYRYKRFFYSFAYSVNFIDKASTEVTSAEVTSAEVSVLIRVNSGNEVRFSREMSHIWDFEHILMIPPRKNNLEKLEKKKTKLKKHKA